RDAMMMEEPARHMMGGMMGSPMTQGAMMAATGFAAGRGLLGGVLLRNPLLLIGAGLVAGYLVHKYEKEIVLAAFDQRMALLLSEALGRSA
ncbi:MAG: hypothetical protein L6Q67_23145, partial [Zoogloea sp.]|nr:hypothetical protein [Zoogloea sp.]